MRTPLSALKGGGRVVRGTVSSTGAITAGTGFRVVRNGAGNYTIFYLTPFNALPSVEVTGAESGQITFARIDAQSGYSFQILLFDPTSATNKDAAFDITATEQER